MSCLLPDRTRWQLIDPSSLGAGSKQHRTVAVGLHTAEACQLGANAPNWGMPSQRFLAAHLASKTLRGPRYFHNLG
jgi:hypothetical protein